MKKFYLLILVPLVSCSVSTTPTMPQYSFPNSYKLVSVTFKNLPQHLYNSYYSHYMVGNSTSSSLDTGTGLNFTDGWNFTFGDSIFKKFGDTLEAYQTL